jgi:hypothetical protein
MDLHRLLGMIEELNRARYEYSREQVINYELALDRALPKTIGPIFAGKNKNFTPPAIPTYDEAMLRRKTNQVYSPMTATRYDNAHEKDQFVDHQWWKVKDKDIIEKQQRISGKLKIGGAKALNRQQHLEELNEMLTQEDVDGLDQS